MYRKCLKTLYLISEKHIPSPSLERGLIQSDRGEMMGKNRSWFDCETEYLEDNWGKLSVGTIAKKLGKSENAVILKAKRIGLGPSISAQGKLNANQLADAIGVDIHAIIDYWIPKYGLRAVRKVTRLVNKFWLIDIKDFWKWAEKNQDKFDSRRFEPLSLGPEPKWMKEKRKADMSLPVRRFQKWTVKEDEKLRAMFKSGLYNRNQIGEHLGRSGIAVQRRLTRIDVWQCKSV